jgi:SPX domain protein involved in polyphosphate accumulation
MVPRIQTRRRELKFLINEQIASSIKQFLGNRLTPDPYSQRSESNSYHVCSVYLDSRNSQLYNQTTSGIKNRYKLRVRIYEKDSDQPAYMEVKRRDGDAIKKQRTAVDRSVATSILAGDRNVLGELFAESSMSRMQWQAITEFCHLRDRIGAVGTVYVSYMREAYVSPETLDWRATFDRRLVTKPYAVGEPLVIPDDFIRSKQFDNVVLELKYSNRLPNWMQVLVRTFNLRASSFPKYIHCVDSLTAARSKSGFPAPRIHVHKRMG